jgi:outer membrane protein assembly factor BamB
MWNLVGSTLIHVLTAIFTVTVWQFATREKSPYSEPLTIGGGSAWSQLYDGPSANWASGQDERNQIPPAQPAAGPSGSWLGWGADVYNNRWAGTDAAVATNNVNSLVQTCSQKYNPGVSAPPLVLDGVAYFVTWGGLAVALDYRHCRPLWQTNVTRIIRTFQPTPNIAEAAGVVASVARTTPVVSGNTLFIGTLGNALVVALHRSTGRLIDSLQLSDHPFAAITSSPTFYGGRLYVGLSSLEEDSIAIPGYKCCSFIGSMNAVSLRHGRLRLDWTVPTIPKHLNISGGAVWGSAPAIDPIRGQVFFATGNAYEVDPQFSTCQEETANLTVVQSGLVRDPCVPNNALLESIVALDLETGRINWARQMSPLDAWNLACFPALVPGGQVPPGVCPPVPGPDSDFGMAPTFVLGSEHTPHGLDIVVAGQKNGNLYALSAAAGTVLWSTITGPTGLEGGLIWGMGEYHLKPLFLSVHAGTAPQANRVSSCR